jgi:hypothetical protein
MLLEMENERAVTRWGLPGGRRRRTTVSTWRKTLWRIVGGMKMERNVVVR